MKKLCVSTSLLLCLAGCSTTAIRVADIHVAPSSQETFKLLQAQANRCWTAGATPFKKGILVRSVAATDQGYSITAHPVHWNYGAEKRAFVTILISSNESGSLVTVDEGSPSCTLVQGCPSLGLKDDVENWLKGDLSCKDISNQLLRLGTGL